MKSADEPRRFSRWSFKSRMLQNKLIRTSGILMLRIEWVTFIFTKDFCPEEEDVSILIWEWEMEELAQILWEIQKAEIKRREFKRDFLNFIPTLESILF
jgi:hypothetical protein